MIRWLHISDLHIKNKADWNSYRKELLKKCSEIGKINLVIVTGDFHDFSDGVDFEYAKSFLRELVKKLELDIGYDLFLIPGNHDGVTPIADKKLYVSAARNNPLDMDKAWIYELMSSFRAYESFVRELIPDYPVEHPAGVHSRVWRNKINFIHCNTALVADGSTKINQIMDVDALALLEFSEDCPNIILAHNNFDDLNKEIQKSIKDVIRTNPIRAYLCGDRHIESATQITYEDKQNRQIPCIGCYKSAPDPTDDYSNFGIIIGEWQEDKMDLRGWSWKRGEGFKVDGNVTEQKIYMGSMEKNEIVESVSKNDCVDMKLEDDYNRDINECYKHRKEFITTYHRLSPYQLSQFNRKYSDKYGKLKKRTSEKELYDYVIMADKNLVLESMLEYIKTL
ncbi:MAG: metallophosphoesterase family protein [Roseburia sp. 1XD42-69]